MSTHDIWAYFHDMAQRQRGRRPILEEDLLDAMPLMLPHGGVIHCNAALYWAARVNCVSRLYVKIHGVKV